MSSELFKVVKSEHPHGLAKGSRAASEYVEVTGDSPLDEETGRLYSP
jgi:hypothetical protein